MADYQLDSNGQYIDYPNTAAFLNGASPTTTPASPDGTYYPKVDMSLWDQATMCGTCHVGGVFYERDRQGKRLPQRAWDDMMAGKINPITSTVWENYDPVTGADASFVTSSPWLMPAYEGNDPTKPAMTMPFGWVPGPMPMANKNGVDPTNPMAADAYQLVAKQLMIPNVKEMDCLFCHYNGYDNIPASVMTQAGSLYAAPTAGAGLFDMTPVSPSYMGYNPYNGKVAFTTVKTTPLYANMTTAANMMNWPAFKAYSTHELVSLTSVVTNNIVPKPSTNNCLACHATKTLKDLPEMFGATGTSSGFLSSAPMIYDPANPNGPLGKRMVAYDVKALFALFGMGPDPALTSAMLMGPNAADYMMGSLPWPNAMGKTPFNFASWNDPDGFIGGGNAAGATPATGLAAGGPLYYYNVDPTTGAAVVDQNILKRSTMPFPRAEWFKRGDAWQDGQDVHGNLGCAGCHYTGDTVGANKNQCDPGRGFDTASGVMDSVPPLGPGGIVYDHYSSNGKGVEAVGAAAILAATRKNDTRNTVKRCEFCHITGKDYFGNTINTFGAPNPTAKHQAYGLAGSNDDGSGPGPANAKVQMVDHYNLHGRYGGKGVPRETRFDTDDTDVVNLSGPSAGTPGGTILNPNGNHLDVIDCTVCHVHKTSMAVRSLEALSGMRFPAVIGTDPSKGMFGLFEDPTGMGAANTGMGGALGEWKPLVMWQAQGNKILPLDLTNDSSELPFRRKLHLSNSITAILWNNEGSTIDANGDGAPGGDLLPSKPSLAGRKDIFSGDDPDENNTQGYGVPIFDPWIQKDLKAGFNFGPSPLSVISVGFGADQTATGYASIYDAAGNFSTTRTQYASIWSGAFVFTEADQIKAYKDHRGTDWADTTITMVGAPFMITHGVKPVSQHVLGKSCSDCHAPQKGFFKGSFDMIGSAIPASTTYNPSQAIVPDYYGNIQIDPATGDPIRLAGMPGMTFNDALAGSPFAGMGNSMLVRPLEPIRIKANKGDLRGYLEATNKLGQFREVSFVHDTTDLNPATSEPWSYASTIDRYQALYPPTDGHDTAIYYKIGDVRADGTPKAIAKGDTYNALPITGAEYAAYLETIGAAPTASFRINDLAPAPDGCGAVATPCTANTGAIAFAANTSTVEPNTTYSWTFSDDTSKNTTGATATRTINTVKSFTVTLIAKNSITGATATTKKIVKTQAPAAVALTGVDTTATGDTTVSLTGLPTHSKLYVKWGDGTEQYVTSSAAAIDLTHKYLKTGTMNVAINIINGTTLVAKKTCAITVKPVITASAVVNGTLTPVGVTQILSGASQTYTIAPTATLYAGYAIANVLVNGASVGPVASYTFTGLTAPSSTISATFKPTINAVQTANGSIAPAGVTPVTSGGSQYYTITPANGYHVATVTVNGVPAAVATSYNFTNVTEPMEITATYAAN
ncbi:MAG: hypothetical protein NDI77_01990 [Geobacteraceae bacterium]|nr:hypothetical protein [Geobacteraceae bacterium]